MKAIYKWLCWDCNNIGEEVFVEGEKMTLTELLTLARGDTTRKYYEAVIYCPTCKEDKATITIPTGLTVAYAVGGRVSILTSYEEDGEDVEEIAYSL